MLAARTPNKDHNKPAKLKYFALPEGHRERVKFAALAELSIKQGKWADGADAWRAPFLAEQGATWAAFSPLESIFEYSGSGVMPGRTWIIAPDVSSLEQRWLRLTTETQPEKREELFHPHEGGDKTSTKRASKGLAGHEARLGPVSEDKGRVVSPVRYAFRSLDRQWIIPDNRLINRPNPALWETYSSHQVFLTAPEDRTPENGASITATNLIPDLHHYHGRGGRVYPLWRNAEATVSNIKPTLLNYLALRFGRSVSPDDLVAYIAGVMSHSAFTARFRKDLVRPGLRLPITAEVALFEKAVDLGREVIWLHSYGESFVDEGAGRPAGAPRVEIEGPTIPKAGAISGAPEDFPAELRYDTQKKRLVVGTGFIDNVTQSMVDYEVSGMNVLRQWFSYRKKDRRRPIIGDRRPPSPLVDIQAGGWLSEYTSDLLDLLHVLGRVTALEPKQAVVLDQILSGALIEYDDLVGAGALSGEVEGEDSEEN